MAYELSLVVYHVGHDFECVHKTLSGYYQELFNNVLCMFNKLFWAIPNSLFDKCVSKCMHETIDR